MITEFTVPSHDLPDRRMINPEMIDSRYWTLHCVAAEAMTAAGITLDPGGMGVRADVIGVRHPVTGEYGHIPTPKALCDKVVQPADDYLRGLSNRRHIRGGKFFIDWDTFLPRVRKVIPRPANPKGNTAARKKSNATWSTKRRAARNTYLRGTV